MTKKNCKLNGEICPNCGKIHKDKTGKNHPMYGQKPKQESIEKIKKKLLGRFKGKKNPFYGKEHTEEVMKKISNTWFKPGHTPVHKKNFNEKKIIELCKTRSPPQIAKQFNCSKIVIYRILKEQGIKTKPRGFFLRGHIPWNKNKKGTCIGWCKHLTKDTDERIRKMVEKGALTRKQRYANGTIKRPFGKLNPMYGRTLEKHPNWQGGKSFEPYGLDFNGKFREKIRERDDYCCVICNTPQEELNHQLHVHHIDYDKTNTFPQNCVPLCRKCHIKTNYNRKSWIVFFQSLLVERYNYQYSQDQKIILDFTKGS